MVTFNGGIWTVPLAATHQPYTHCEFKRELPNDNRYDVVIVDLSKLIEFWGNGPAGYLTPPVIEWEKDKREGIWDFLDPSTGAAYMPRIGFEVIQRPEFFGLFGAKKIPMIGFVNGRHRTRYLEFAGASCIPVETNKANVPLLQQYCACIC